MLETLLAFFAVGEIGFFILLTVLGIIYTSAVQRNRHGLAILGTIVAGFLLWEPIKLALTNWRVLLFCTAIYIILGSLWSIFRWFKCCREYISEHPWEKVSSFQKENYTPEEYYSERLAPSDHKSRIISWIIYWPWSLFWNVSGDIFTGIYDCLTDVYTSVASSVIKKATASVRFENVTKINKSDV
jgi:hypothetical protein